MPSPLLVLHTTEGSSLDSAVETMQERNTPSHLVLEPSTRRRAQLLPWNSTAMSLKNLRGDEDLGVETNRRGKVYQVEIVGFVDPARAESKYHIDRWPAEWWDWLATEIEAVCNQLGVPIDFPYDFGTYPETAGFFTRWRLAKAEWESATGIVGHLHVPENDHGDPSHMRPLIDRLAPGRLNESRMPVGLTSPAQGGNVDPEVLQFQRAFSTDPNPSYGGVLDGDFGPKSLAAALAVLERRNALEQRVAEQALEYSRKVSEVEELSRRLDERRAQINELTAALEAMRQNPIPSGPAGVTVDQVNAALARADWVAQYLRVLLEAPRD